MRTVINRDNKVVCLIRVRQNTPILRRPKVLDYKNPAIRQIIPCIKQGEKFFELRTRKSVTFDADTLEWPVSVGTVFAYKDGQNILISRKIMDHLLLVLTREEFKFNPMSMVCYDVK